MLNHVAKRTAPTCRLAQLPVTLTRSTVPAVALGDASVPTGAVGGCHSGLNSGSSSSAGSGTDRPKPWPWSHPSVRSDTSCSSVSMPSAIVVSSRLCARSMIPRVSATVSGLSRSRMKVRSELDDVDRKTREVARTTSTRCRSRRARWGCRARFRSCRWSRFDSTVVEDHALGDLEDEPAPCRPRWRRIVFEDLGDVACARADAAREVPRAGAVPGSRTACGGDGARCSQACATTHSADGDDVAGLLGDGDGTAREAARPAVGGASAATLEAGDAAGPQLDDRLVHHGKLLVVERLLDRPSARGGRERWSASRERTACGAALPWRLAA